MLLFAECTGCSGQAGLRWQQEGWHSAFTEGQPVLGAAFSHTGWMDDGP